ncbi:MAG: NADH-quinone oxidoreductase subunit NuoB [Candidatus Bathyarchaeota archaeon]|nr:NADH-quinone oxidoreductase subunit NuoB [Candidatus Bathyarchaeota archaeon]
MSWARSNSPWLLHFNSGSCNGCDIEIVASRAPKFDLERFGILVKGSPRHADILAVTGPVTRQSESRLLRIYRQMPLPKYVIAIGSCAASGAPFIGSYNVYEGVHKVLPVDVYVGGCPPRPEAIIHGVLRLIEKIRKGLDEDSKHN